MMATSLVYFTKWCIDCGHVVMAVFLAGTVTRSPLRYLPYFPYKPPKPTTIGIVATGIVAIATVAAAFYSQGQLAAQLANFSI